MLGRDGAPVRVVVHELDGTVYTAGDSDVEFTIQSISKAFVYGLAIEDRGFYSMHPLRATRLQALVDEEVARAGERGEKPTMKQMGAIIKAVTARAEGRSDGRTISGMVRAALS